jgi:hypothetical protein
MAAPSATRPCATPTVDLSRTPTIAPTREISSSGQWPQDMLQRLACRAFLLGDDGGRRCGSALLRAVDTMNTGSRVAASP